MEFIWSDFIWCDRIFRLVKTGRDRRQMSSTPWGYDERWTMTTTLLCSDVCSQVMTLFMLTWSVIIVLIIDLCSSVDIHGGWTPMPVTFHHVGWCVQPWCLIYFSCGLWCWLFRWWCSTWTPSSFIDAVLMDNYSVSLRVEATVIMWGWRPRNARKVRCIGRGTSFLLAPL